MASANEQLRNLRMREAELIARMNEERMRSGPYSSNLMWIQRDLDEVRQQIRELENPINEQLAKAQREYPTLFGREYYLIAPNGVRVDLSPFDRERIVTLILSGKSREEIQALIDTLLNNAGFYGSDADGDVENPRLFGSVMMFPFKSLQSFIDRGINFYSPDPRAIKLGDEVSDIEVSKKKITLRFRASMIDTAEAFYTRRVLNIWNNLGPAIKSWWTSTPDPFWVGTLGYHQRRVAIRQWIRSNKSSIKNIDDARQWFAVNWPAVCLVENDVKTIGEDWARLLALETGYTLNMMQQRSNVYVYDQTEVDAEIQWAKTAEQRLSAWITTLNKDEKALINGVVNNTIDALPLPSFNSLLLGLGLVAVILIAK